MQHITDAPTGPTAEPPPRASGPLINRNFALLWSGGGVSAIGDMIFNTTLILWIAAGIGRGQSWAPLAVSGLVIVTSLPILLVGPLAGVFVDRWDKRHTMLAMDGARAVLIALLLLATNLVPLPFVAGGRLGPSAQLIAIYAIVLLASGCAQFFNPGRLALIGDIVAEGDRARAAGMTQTVSALAIVIGPALAGPLYFAAGVQWALLINALSFVVSFVAVRAVRAPRAARSVAPGQARSMGAEWREGLVFFARNRILRTLLMTIVLILLGGGALNALDVFFVTQNLHVAASLYGNMEAVYGAGAVVGALVATLIARWLGAARTFWVSVLLLASAVVVLSRLTSYYPALVAQFLIGVPNAAMNAMAGPLLLHTTPRRLVGRVSAILTPTATLVSLVSAGLAGYLLSGVMSHFHATFLGFTFGPVDTIFSVAGVIGILSSFYACWGLRGVRLAGERGGPRIPAVEPETAPALAGEPA